MTDPVRQFEHSHDRVTRLALEVHEMLRGEPAESIPQRLVEPLKLLRDELVHHFANEEEALFPFIRRQLPTKWDAVDRLAEAHDTLCWAIVRLVALVESDDDKSRLGHSALVSLYESFEANYVVHSREEAALLEELDRKFNEHQREKLREALRGL